MPTFSGIHGFPHSEVAPLLDTMLQAHREGDTETFDTACDSAVFRAMDNEVGVVSGWVWLVYVPLLVQMAKLVRDLKGLSGGSVIRSLGSGEMMGVSLLAPVEDGGGQLPSEPSLEVTHPTGMHGVSVCMYWWPVVCVCVCVCVHVSGVIYVINLCR